MEEEGKMPKVRRVRAELVGGPWWDGLPCVRFLDLTEAQSLFDLHEGLLAAVAFEGDYPFYFFRAEAPEGPREMVPASLPPRPLAEDIDDDPYEDENAWAALGAGRAGAHPLFDVLLAADGEWVFRLSAAGPEAIPRVPDALYPETVESLSIGPDPAQYGYDLDDFAEDDEPLQPFAARGAGPFADASGDPSAGPFDEGEDDFDDEGEE